MNYDLRYASNIVSTLHTVHTLAGRFLSTGPLPTIYKRINNINY